MIDNNIIKSLGAGSGIDTNNLVKQLVSLERAGPQQRIDEKRELTESRISDFGLLSSSLATLQDAAKVLTEPEGLFSKTAAFTESDALVPTELSTDVQPGVYSFEVTALAQAQSLSFVSFDSITDSVGEGTLTFNFGSWARDGSDNPLTFSQNTDKESVTITIDSTNNTLKGLRDAINAADFGVQASIINDGNGYRLSLLAESGEDNQIEINVSEAGGTPTDTDANDLSRFAFNSSVTGFEGAETQVGRDAALTINGLSVTRPTNTIDDIVDGLTLDILKAAPGEKITVTVSEDKAFAEQNIRDFVTAYNDFLEAIKPAFGVSEEENEEGEKVKIVGSLTNDALAKSVISQIKTVIASAIPGLADSNFTSLTNVGIRTELDGTLSINEKDFETAFKDHFEDVQKLFAPRTVSSDDAITVNSTGEKTAVGEYDIVITTPPSRGYYTGGDIDNAAVVFPDFDTTGKDYTFKVKVNGTESDTITIPDGTYSDEASLAAIIQSMINADENLKAVNASVTVSYNSGNDGFDITSSQYGVNSTVSITESSTQSTDELGLAVAGGTAGTKVAGTINGVAGFGSANVLLPALGQPGEGLAMIVGENATSATINYSRGFAGELEDLVEQYLVGNGLIDTREANLEDTLEDLDDDQENLDRKMSAYEERLIQQYIAMERILNGLNSSGSFLDNLVDTLPFTASKD